jgi:hypothetical protein
LQIWNHGRSYVCAVLAAVGVSVVGALATKNVDLAQKTNEATGAANNGGVTGRVASGVGVGDMGSRGRDGGGVGSSREGDDSDDLGELHLERSFGLTGSLGWELRM